MVKQNMKNGTNDNIENQRKNIRTLHVQQRLVKVKYPFTHQLVQGGF